MTTFLSAMAARLGAPLAMVLAVLGAFLSAGVTNFGAEAADLMDEL
jgi:low affinity Fe/Cu permease